MFTSNSIGGYAELRDRVNATQVYFRQCIIDREDRNCTREHSGGFRTLSDDILDARPKCIHLGRRAYTEDNLHVTEVQSVTSEPLKICSHCPTVRYSSKNLTLECLQSL